MRIRQYLLSTLAIIATCGLLAPDAGALSVLPLDLDQLVAGAEDIAHVRCVSNRVEQDPSVGVVTVTTFVTFDRARGAAGTSFVVRQPGGASNGLVVDYHVPKFVVGSEYVLFMPRASHLGLASPVGFAQGVFDVAGSPEGSGKDVGNGRDFGELLPGANARSVPTGIAARLQRTTAAKRSRVDLTDFMNMVRAKAATR